jgi:hypothetical protein
MTMQILSAARQGVHRIKQTPPARSQLITE